jgi:hypothetical protein
MLWSADAGMIGLLSPARGYGDLDLDRHDTPMEKFHIEAWAPKRRFAALLKDGRRVLGTAETVQRYEVPIYGRHWHGHVVRAEVDGHPMVGMINDWKPEAQPYGLS